MSVTVHLKCSGCFATAEPFRVGVNFEQVSPDWVRRRVDRIEDAAPDGWVPFDPYTGVCYCPTCWASIEGEVSKATPKEAGR